MPEHHTIFCLVVEGLVQVLCDGACVRVVESWRTRAWVVWLGATVEKHKMEWKQQQEKQVFVGKRGLRGASYLPRDRFSVRHPFAGGHPCACNWNWRFHCDVMSRLSFMLDSFSVSLRDPFGFADVPFVFAATPFE